MVQALLSFLTPFLNVCLKGFEAERERKRKEVINGRFSINNEKFSLSLVVLTSKERERENSVRVYISEQKVCREREVILYFMYKVILPKL